MILPLYENIRKFRKEKKMSQEKLAELTGYSDRSSIAKIEKGEVDLPQSKIFLFARALGVTPSELMGNSGTFAILASQLGIPEADKLLEQYDKLSSFHQQDVLDYINYLQEKERHTDAS